MQARSELALVLAVAATAASCGKPPLPPRLAGLARVRVVSGHQAARLVEHAHGRSVAPPDSLVADYGRRRELRVWMSRFRDFPTAHGELDKMLRAMRSHATPFSTPWEDRRLTNRWVTVGNGAHHLVWVSGRTLYWLEGDPVVVFAAADELPAPSPARFL